MQAKAENYVTAVIGGGLTGMMTALNIANSPDYKGTVRLYEKREMLATWGAAVANQLHLGLEYLLDPKHSMQQCAIGAIIFKFMLPNHCFRTDTTSFMLTQETVDSGKITVKEFHNRAIKNIWEPYQLAFRLLKNYAGWSIDEATQNLFGTLDPEKFFLMITDKAAFEKYGNMGGGIAGGFRTPQPAFNIPVIGAYLETAIRNHPKIKVYCDHSVTSMEPYKGEMNEISFENGDEHLTNAVITSAAEGAVFLGHRLPSKMTVFSRGIIVAKVNPGFEFEPSFLMEGTNGGMISPYTNELAFLYPPRELDLGEAELSASQTELSPFADCTKKLQRGFEVSMRRFPFLQGNIERYCMLSRRTISFNGANLTKRQMPPICKIDGLPNAWLVFSTKATHAAAQSVNMESLFMYDYKKNLGVDPGFVRSDNPIENILSRRRDKSPFLALREDITIDPEIFRSREEHRLSLLNGMFPEEMALSEKMAQTLAPWRELANRGALQEVAKKGLTP